MTQNDPRRWWALGGLTLAVLAVGLDGTVLSVALPTLAKALHASESDLQWFSSGYLLVLAAAMLPLGLLGDRYGRKKVMLGSLALFGAGSAACAYSTTSASSSRPGSCSALRVPASSSWHFRRSLCCSVRRSGRRPSASGLRRTSWPSPSGPSSVAGCSPVTGGAGSSS